MIDLPKRSGYRLTYDAQMYYDDWREYGGCRCFQGNAPCSSCTHEGHPISLEENDEAWELDNEEVEMSRQSITDKSSPPKSEWFGFKYRVTPETSKLLQEAVFKDGGGWYYEDRNIQLTDEPFLYVTSNGEIGYGTSGECFIEDGRKEKQPPQPKKDFVVGKWYKCVEPSESNGLERNKYYELLNATAVSEGLRFAGKADGCYWSKSRFDRNSESDYNPDTAHNKFFTLGKVTKCSETTNDYAAKIVVLEEVLDSYDYNKFFTFSQNKWVSQNKWAGADKWFTDDRYFGGHETDNIFYTNSNSSNQHRHKTGNGATTTVGDVNMSIQRKSVKVELFDNDKGLPVEHSLVGSWVDYVTEDSDSVTIQEIISTGEVADLLNHHNAVRIDLIDEEILTRTGNSVNLRPIKLKNLTWMVDGRRVS